MQKHEYEIHKSFLKEPEIKNIPAPSNELATKIFTLETALNKAMTGLRELKDWIACPPDIKYEDCVSMYAGGVIEEVEKILERSL